MQLIAIKNGYYLRPSSSSRTGSFSSVIIVLLIMGIIIGLVVAGFFAMGQIAGTSSEGVDVLVQVSGNDVLITLIADGHANPITGLRVSVDGYAPSDANSSLQNPQMGTPIQFAGVAKDVTGYAFIIVDAEFLDGTQRVIKYARMRFS
ncbi:hypothetical protein [Methanocorpusculum vombati]|uniref:Archaeal Type IV pilin N-terminal domain-containing protein n=1 Tax=Methanocorpusculum vombati TaxID=3002864 RepID=A0ABT4IJX1_9EURY|nr:hypothetical protein [Methanocorpusculum vombati]MCZ9319485.1 hypothetical protein [Methanocorpusculum sp.]MCZ0862027.1 hypothetical protein [Methanocorpusculum vombati]MDE2520422.1 hypothetical protein [Methanocorpusculum sp.]MDE2534091.1 hypothetical protein [Methanocorpusculum sp.]MDE2545688.1 hypothetical protein [Methanocorpusculum sp.]